MDTLVSVKLTGKVNGEAFDLIVQKSCDGKWVIPTSEIGSCNDNAIRIGYKYFSESELDPTELDEINPSDQLDKIPHFYSQMIAAASAANAVHW